MDKIEYRFLIYEDFKKDAPFLFAELCEKFNFIIIDSSIYGIHLVNNRCELDMTSETGSIQLWLKISKYSISQMIPVLSMFKGDEVYLEYKKIVAKDCSKNQILELVDFLVKNFSNELSPR